MKTLIINFLNKSFNVGPDKESILENGDRVHWYQLSSLIQKMFNIDDTLLEEYILEWIESKTNKFNFESYKKQFILLPYIIDAGDAILCDEIEDIHPLGESRIVMGCDVFNGDPLPTTLSVMYRPRDDTELVARYHTEARLPIDLTKYYSTFTIKGLNNSE